MVSHTRHPTPRASGPRVEDAHVVYHEVVPVLEPSHASCAGVFSVLPLEGPLQGLVRLDQLVLQPPCLVHTNKMKTYKDSPQNSRRIVIIIACVRVSTAPHSLPQLAVVRRSVTRTELRGFPHDGYEGPGIKPPIIMILIR